MTALQILGIGTFLMAYYYFVLRTYNTLGFRMFSLFFFVGFGVCYWWYTNYANLKDVQTNGVPTQALILKKTDNSLVVRFTDLSGKAVTRTQTGGISVDEFAAVTEGQLALVLYSPQSDTVFLTSSYRRQLKDTRYFLVFPGLLFLIGSVCMVCLRKYRVHAYEGTIFEYVTDESGKVVLDDTRNHMTKALRTYSTMSKFFQLFDR